MRRRQTLNARDRQRTVYRLALACLCGLLAVLPGVCVTQAAASPGESAPLPPAHPVKLIFIHDFRGANWLADYHGGLGQALLENNYFVSDTSDGWGPTDLEAGGKIGSHTDLGHWWNWFLGPYRDTYLTSLFSESGPHSLYSRMAVDPGGPNEIVLFTSSYWNSNLAGAPDDPPSSGPNPMYGQPCCADYTVGHAKALYRSLLDYFQTRQDVLFVVIAAPPLKGGSTTPLQAANARAFNRWLVNDWLSAYPYQNVMVFDYYNVLTSNGGDPNTNDLDRPTGNHHRYRAGAVEYITTEGENVSAYTVGSYNDPTVAGNQKATAEFVPLLNLAYARWQHIYPPRAYLPMILQ